MLREIAPMTLDVRHLVVRAPDVHPGEANGVVGVARKLVLEQLAAGERARLVMIAHEGIRAASAEQVPAPEMPVDILPLAGIAIGGITIRLRNDVTLSLLSGFGANTVFHIHGGREPLLAGVGAALRRRRVPYVVTPHGRFSHIYDADGRCQKPRTAIYLALVERGLLEGARFVQALSPEEARILRRIAPRARIEIVGNGAYSSKRDPAPASSVARLPSASFPHFVYCGRYATHHKGLDLLVQGFAQYRRSGGQGRLTTIGTGPERTALVVQAKQLQVADAMEIGGPLFGEERDAALQRCDFFIMASRFEGLPLAALEAALLGLPLVVTSGTGLRTQVEAHRAGIAIEAPSAEAVCAAMHRAGAQSAGAWAASGASAFRFAVAFADWTAIAERLRRMYRTSARAPSYS